MKKLFTLIIISTALFAGSAMAQSSKFAADWDDELVSVKAEIVDPATVATCSGSGATGGTGTSGDPCVIATSTLTTLDVAQQKDLLIGVSAEVGLVTFTQAKGKHSSTGTATEGSATAGAGVKVTLELRDSDTNALVQTAAPGQVTFASRIQEIKVDVTECEVPIAPLVATFDADCEVLVSLLLDTVGAHHFNFIGVDLDQGFYDVVAVFDLSAFAEIVGEDAAASAEVILGPRMVTAQEVRAAKGALEAL
jgi:hypothetical protein